VAIVGSGLGADAVLTGAAELAFSGLIEDPAASAGHSVGTGSSARSEARS